MDRNEANDILNRFEGRRCKGRATGKYGLCEHGWFKPHEVLPFNYFADTPETRERVRLLKDEFVRRLHGRLSSAVHWDDGSIHFTCYITTPSYWVSHQLIESHAIALAIAEALKARRQ